jgi:hypothetical protein
MRVWLNPDLIKGAIDALVDRAIKSGDILQASIHSICSGLWLAFRTWRLRQTGRKTQKEWSR